MTEGTYTVVPNIPRDDQGRYVPGRYASGGASVTDTRCHDTLAPARASFQSGTVVITEIAFTPGGTTAGTFDLVVGEQGDKLSGDFSSILCPTELSRFRTGL